MQHRRRKDRSGRWGEALDFFEAVGGLLGVPKEKVLRVILPVGHPVSEGRRPKKKMFDERAWFDRHGG